MSITVGSATASIVLDKIHLNTTLDADAWGRPERQPTILSVQADCNIGSAATQDDYSQTLDYSSLTKDLRRLAAPDVCRSLFGFLTSLGELIAIYNSEHKLITGLNIKLALPEALRNSSEGVAWEFSFQEPDLLGKLHVSTPLIRLNGINVPCIIGIKDRERLVKQTLRVSAELQLGTLAPGEAPNSAVMPLAWKQDLAQLVFDRMSESTFQTAEAAAHGVGKLVEEYLMTILPDSIATGRRQRRAWLLSVSVLKPSAISGVGGAGVTLRWAPPTESSR